MMRRLFGLLLAGLLLAGLLSACDDGTFTKDQMQAAVASAASNAYAAGFFDGTATQKKKDDLQAMQKAHVLENAATVGNLCNLFGPISRALCPRHVLAAGDAAIAAGAAPAAWLVTVWSFLAVILAVAGLAAFGAVLYWLVIRWLAPARREAKDAERLVTTAQEQVESAKRTLREKEEALRGIEDDIAHAQRALLNSQKKAEMLKEQIQNQRAELETLERKIEARKREYQDLLGGFS
ncbi:MAG TPA: hypothetical protein PKE37_16840 [Thiomonas arsenitoxydans]|uniref:hypothetical protein n=1 Tax=Thiomonas arsenitoxydans (strain DSM 22701 / CIP 110005 / 3As) TaxID=426114 RepID=UPI002C117AE4|nr:hypothetical protein [Thiomonas arsenitoxydans]HML83419.1 hypothetical protein [Thiomonas arsenitoxydans]